MPEPCPKANMHACVRRSRRALCPGAVKHGYANVGVVERGPRAGSDVRVFCLYPHQTRYVVPRDAVVPLPPARAGQSAPCWPPTWKPRSTRCGMLRPRVGDRITVVGAGVIGSLVAGLCAGLPGGDVELVDIDADRAAVASALGVAFTPPGDRE